MFFVYIIFSESKNEFYVGQTNSVKIRIAKHNSAEVISTKHGMPWKIIITFEIPTRTEAIKLERKIKKRGIKRYLQDINFGA